MASLTAPQTSAGRRVMKYLNKLEKRLSIRKRYSKLAILLSSLLLDDEIPELSTLPQLGV